MCRSFLFPMQKNGFTLIEVLIVISIIAIVSMLSYSPYSHYSNISKVRFSAQKIEQTLSEAKSSTIGWYSLSGANVHIWLVFSGGLDKILMKWYPFSMGTGMINAETGTLIREIPLENNVVFENNTNGMVVFLSPGGDSWWAWSDGQFTQDGNLKVNITFRGASPGSSLEKKINIGKIVTIE